jgi:hypothetical protein
VTDPLLFKNDAEVVNGRQDVSTEELAEIDRIAAELGIIAQPTKIQ